MSICQDADDRLNGFVNVLVYNAVLVAVGLEKFAVGNLQPTGHGIRRLRAAALEPQGKLVRMRWFDKDRQGSIIPSQNRKRTLNVNFEDNPRSSSQSRGHFFDQRAIPVLPSIDLAALQKLPSCPPPLKFSEREKVVVNAVLLAVSGRSRGGRYAWNELRKLGQNGSQNRCFAHARRARDDHKLARCCR